MRTSVKRFSKSLVAGIAAGAMAISGLAVAFTASPAAAAATTSRVGGANRYDTARLAALANFPGGSANAVLASGENFPDGLAASDLAGALGVPLLLTPAASLAPETVAALATLNVHTVYVVGGTAAVSAAVIAQLQGLGYTVPAATAGPDRYATSAAVATAAAASAPVGTISGLKTAIVATGLNFPDALSAGSASYFAHLPILLTDPNTLSASVSTAITSLGIKNVLIMGGTTAVSAAVETALKAVVTTTRIMGADRFATATAMAQLDITATFSGGLAMPAANIALASGLNFPDALVAAEFKAPIVLDDPLPPASAAFLTLNAALIANIMAIGGTAVIPAADLTAAQNAVSPTAGAATFAAIAGATSFTASFAAAINTPILGNFLINNAAIGAGNVQQTGPTSFLIWGLAAPLKPGDIVSINGAAPPTAASNGATVPFSSFTVPANAAPAVVSVNFFTGGHAVSVTFSKPVVLNGGVTCAGACGALTLLAGGGVSGTAGVSQDGTTFTWSTAAAIVATDRLNISIVVTDQSAGLVALPAAVSYSPTANTVAPAVSLALHNVVTTAPFAVTHGAFTLAAAGGWNVGANVVSVSAKPGGAADGSLGAGFLIAPLTITAGQTGVGVTTATVAGVTTISISYPAATFASGATLAAALNANAVFASVLVANGTGAAAVGATVTGGTAATALAGGTTTWAISAVISKQVVPTNVATDALNWTVSSGAPNDGAAPVTTVNVSSAPSVVTILFTAGTPATTIVPGTTTLSFTAHTAITDFAGNVMAASSTTIS